MASRAVLFDVDGTLVDSRPWYERAFAALGHPVNGVRSRLEDNCPPVKLADELGIPRRRLALQCGQTIDRLEPYAGVSQALGTLKRKGVRLGIVTALPAAYAHLAVAALNAKDLFEVIVAARWGLKRKPSPDGIWEALDALRVEPQSNRVWYVGDTATDREAAQAAGISFAYASWGYGSLQEIAHAEVILKHPAELSDL